MRRYWLIFAQTVTVLLALYFVVLTLRPHWVLFSNNTPNQSNIAHNFPPRAKTQPTPLSYASAVRAAAPSVVSIYTTKKITASFGLPDVPSLRPFIQEQAERAKNTDNTNLGSGVIATKDGYILTNYHVVEAADSIEIALDDGRKTRAYFIGSDPETDLAVLKIDLPNLVPIPYDPNLKLNVGDIVLAIGNPFGVGQTTTLGIISALDRNGLGINTYENFIQTDAAINPGNSGGALVNVNGNFIGINTAIYTESDNGGSLGIGFATPAGTALKIMDEIIKTGHVARGWLGIEPQNMTDELAKAFNLKEADGIIISSLVLNGPAAKAGLQVGDILLKANNQMIIDSDQMLYLIANMLPKEKIRFTLLRSGKRMNVVVTLGERPSELTSTHKE